MTQVTSWVFLSRDSTFYNLTWLMQDMQERVLIKKIMEATQGMHDRDLAQLRNEIRRKDDQINVLQGAKMALEISLAKHIEVSAYHKL